MTVDYLEVFQILELSNPIGEKSISQQSSIKEVITHTYTNYNSYWYSKLWSDQINYL